MPIGKSAALFDRMLGENTWSSNEKAEMRAKALNLMSMIVGSYGGTLEVTEKRNPLGQIDNCVNFDFPDSVSKAQEFECIEKCTDVMKAAKFQESIF